MEIFRRGDEVVLREKLANMAKAYELILSLPVDFEIHDRDNDLPQEREGL